MELVYHRRPSFASGPNGLVQHCHDSASASSDFWEFTLVSPQGKDPSFMSGLGKLLSRQRIIERDCRGDHGSHGENWGRVGHGASLAC
jgi:hypothetical protein